MPSHSRGAPFHENRRGSAKARPLRVGRRWSGGCPVGHPEHHGGPSPAKFLFALPSPVPARKHNPPAPTAFPRRTLRALCILRLRPLRFFAGSPPRQRPILQEILCHLQDRRRPSCKFAGCVFLTCKIRKNTYFFVTIDKSAKISYDVHTAAGSDRGNL